LIAHDWSTFFSVRFYLAIESH